MNATCNFVIQLEKKKKITCLRLLQRFSSFFFSLLFLKMQSTLFVALIEGNKKWKWRQIKFVKTIFFFLGFIFNFIFLSVAKPGGLGYLPPKMPKNILLRGLIFKIGCYYFYNCHYYLLRYMARYLLMVNMRNCEFHTVRRCERSDLAAPLFFSFFPDSVLSFSCRLSYSFFPLRLSSIFYSHGNYLPKKKSQMTYCIKQGE